MRALRNRVTVQEEGVLELRHAELHAGREADVTIVLEEPGPPPAMASFVGRGQGCFTSAEEVDSFLRLERDSWRP